VTPWLLIDTDPGGDDALDVAGMAFAGIPGVVLGYNQHVAWGATVAVYDVTDAYLETITPGAGGENEVVVGDRGPFVSAHDMSLGRRSVTPAQYVGEARERAARVSPRRPVYLRRNSSEVGTGLGWPFLCGRRCTTRG